MKTSRCNTKFSVTLLIVCLLLTIPVYSGDWLNIAQLDKFKIYINNFTQLLKENANYIAVTVIPALTMFKLISRTTPEGRREQARNVINFYEDKGLFFRMLFNNTQVSEAYLVKGLSDEQLKKFITSEKWLASFGLGFLGFILYFNYKNWNSLDYWDLLTAEQKAKIICSSLENKLLLT